MVGEGRSIHDFGEAAKAWMDRPSPTMRKDGVESFPKNAISGHYRRAISIYCDRDIDP